MVTGLMRWPSFHWELAQAWTGAETAARPALEALFNATNRYLGNYIGEFLGELSMNIFFLLSAGAMLRRGSNFARWIGWVGVITSVAGLIGMFRNAFGIVAPVAAQESVAGSQPDSGCGLTGFGRGSTGTTESILTIAP